MKRTIQLFFALFFLNQIALSQENYLTHSDEHCEILYPGDWDKNTTGQMGTSFILFSPLESEGDKFRENVNLLIQDLQGQKIDLKSFVELSENQVKTLITDGEVLESEMLNNSNGEHHKLVYNGKQGVFNLRFEQYFWIIEGSAYILTFTSEADKFPQYKSVSEKILNSFKMK